MAQDLGARRARVLQVVGVCSAAAISAALIQFTWAAALQPLPLDATTRKAVSPVTLAALATMDGVPSEMTALIARPLFSPTRSPPYTAPPPEPTEAVVPEPPPAPVMQPPNYIVGGVMVSASGRRALLRTEEREKGRWLALGEATAEGWKVASVEADAVTLERAGRSFIVPLKGRARGAEP